MLIIFRYFFPIIGEFSQCGGQLLNTSAKDVRNSIVMFSGVRHLCMKTSYWIHLLISAVLKMLTSIITIIVVYLATVIDSGE